MSSVHEVLYWVEKFQDALRVKRAAERTIEEYGREVKGCLDELARQGKGKLGQVTREDLSQYQTFLYTLKRDGHPLRASTQAKKLAAVKTFFRWLVTEGYLLSSPAEDLEFPRVRKPLPRGILTTSEVVKLLAQPDLRTPLGLRDRAILELLYSSGIRTSELRGVTLGDLDRGRGELRVKGKGSKGRVVPVGQVALQALARYLEEGRPQLVKQDTSVLFLSSRGRPLSRNSVAWLVRKSAREARLKKVVTPHGLRHTCATHLLRGKADLRAIQELLGHASLSTTQVYTRVEISQLKQVHARCHPREKESRKGVPVRGH